MMARLVVVLALLLSVTAAQAVEPSEMLKDPVLEARARAISQEIRCVVCQNQTIDDSNADLAHELRIVLRERLAAGDTDQQVKDFLTARYGDFVLLKPPFLAKTFILWLGPAMVFLIGGAHHCSYPQPAAKRCPACAVERGREPPPRPADRPDPVDRPK